MMLITQLLFVTDPLPATVMVLLFLFTTLACGCLRSAHEGRLQTHHHTEVAWILHERRFQPL